jgi:hypothetical protein
MAISQVSRTDREGSVKNSLRIGIEDGSDIAPIASAAWGEFRNKKGILEWILHGFRYLMAHHRVLRGVPEYRLKSWQSRCFFHLAKTVSEFMFQ